MNRLPRDLKGLELATKLAILGYVITRQKGSHICLTQPGPPETHLTIPAHDPLRVGTLANILDEVSTHLHLSRQEILDRLTG